MAEVYVPSSFGDRRSVPEMYLAGQQIEVKHDA
jgi:hypothetical protein